MNQRVRAVHQLRLSDAREYVGLHEYDGAVQDLSPAGVAAGLAALGQGPKEADRHDEAHLAAAEARERAWLGRLEAHRWNPTAHIANLDLACYDREYAPAEEREAARRRHLASWPEAVAGSIESLDSVPAPVAAGLVKAAAGLSAGLPAGDEPVVRAAREAADRLVAHLEDAALHGRPEVALGADALTALLGDGEATSVDLSRLARVADGESQRLQSLLAEGCGRLDAQARPADVIRRLSADHPDAEGVGPAAGALIGEATEFTLRARLLPELGGECRVGPAPESRRWAMAMMSWSAPYEPDAASWYYVTPPDPTWSPDDQESWLEVFSHTTLPAITVHEVTPGHYAHGRMLRTVRGDVRRGLLFDAFIEGWAHYAEELMLEEGFRAEDPRYQIGVAIEALVRVIRLRSSIGIHTGAVSVEEATRDFETYAYLSGPAARSEAERATYDPTYGRYTWGKLEIMRLRDEARAQWGGRYSHLRFHEALMSLGAPPLGLIGDILM